ncbi:MAG: long-chain fatty acid--CoA ligase [Myxococcales bacterium]|nr:long-chain fatty acid--CoA ligase [Myxococcales bacterium]
MANKQNSVSELFLHRITSTPDNVGIIGRRNNQWYELTWKQIGERVKKIACGLRSLGLEKGARCSILSGTRPEWVIVDMAILTATGATTTIYPSNTPPECSYIINDSGSVFCFAENDTQLKKLIEERPNMPGLKKVIVIDGTGSADGWVISLNDLETKGIQWDKDNPGLYEKDAKAVGPDDLATLIYTSGTTGNPKGVMLTHSNWVYEGEALGEMGIMSPQDKQYLFLPLAHSFAKVMELAFIALGVPTVIDGDVDTLVDNLMTTKPTVMGAVPRIFEKVYNKVVTGAREGGGVKFAIFQWSLGVGRQVSALRQKGQEPTGLLLMKNNIAHKLVFSKLQAKFGGQIKYFISGGAPLSREIAEFFHAAGILVLEGYGLTETSAASYVNRPNQFRFGTVGLPVPGTEVRIAADGEILLKGKGVMRGYYNLPAATAEALEPDGWFHTGDIGEVDKDGFLRITDRKKDIIVTAGGKNIAPQNIENTLKTRSTYISQVVIHGDKRNFCVALVTINEETTGKWAKDHGISYSGYADLASKPQVKDLIWKTFEEVNKELASYETIKKIHLLDHDLTIETGELTPTMKVKRRVVEKRYQSVLDAFYGETLAKL